MKAMLYLRGVLAASIVLLGLIAPWLPQVRPHFYDPHVIPVCVDFYEPKGLRKP